MHINHRIALDILMLLFKPKIEKIITNNSEKFQIDLEKVVIEKYSIFDVMNAKQIPYKQIMILIL